MKRILFFVVLFILSIIAIGTLGYIALLGVGIGLVVWGIRNIIKAPTVPTKLIWGVVVLAGIGISYQYIRFILGILAIGVIYYVYNKYKNKKSQPEYIYDAKNFDTFEKEWDNLK